jgi:hypothetical protein
MGASRSGGGMSSGQKGSIHKQAATLKGKVKIAPRTRTATTKEKRRGE